MRTAPPRRLTVALQGAGALGAFAWGVLDALLEDPSIEIIGASGASAGAMNATALACGLLRGGPAEARRVLTAFWRDVGAATALPHFPALEALTGGPGGFSPGGWMRGVGAMMGGGLTRPPSPIAALSRIVDKHLDTAAVRTGAFRLVLSTTDLATEETRLFREHEVTRAVLLASAALPFVHPPVSIGGAPHVDGGLSANPPLAALAQATGGVETLLVRLLPEGVAQSHSGSLAKLLAGTQMLFNRGLKSEWAHWQALKALAQAPQAAAHPGLAPLTDHRISTLDGAAQMPDGALAQALNPTPRLLDRLCERGRAAGKAWITATASP